MQTDARLTSRILRRVPAVLLALWFLAAGSQKFFAREAFARLFEDLGVAPGLVPVIGAVEIVGAVLVLIPRFTGLGALLLGATMIGAVVSHLTSGHGSPAGALIALGLSAVVAFLFRSSPRRSHTVTRAPG